MIETTHDLMGVAADSTGVSLIALMAEAFPDATIEVKHVVVEQTGASDAQWNVTLGGDTLFSADQSVGAADTPERFDPDQNEYAADETSELALDVNTASATTGSTLNVSADIEVHGKGE